METVGSEFILTLQCFIFLHLLQLELMSTVIRVIDMLFVLEVSVDNFGLGISLCVTKFYFHSTISLSISLWVFLDRFVLSVRIG